MHLTGFTGTRADCPVGIARIKLLSQPGITLHWRRHSEQRGRPAWKQAQLDRIQHGPHRLHVIPRYGPASVERRFSVAVRFIDI
jgi:hypothetical protein